MTAAGLSELTAPPASKRAAKWRRCVTFPHLLVLAFVCVTAPFVCAHPIWRDEAQAFLLARDSATPWDLLWNMRYEGHPPLWHMLLWLLTRITQRPEAMQWFHLALAAASVYIVARWSPFPRVLRIAFAFGYFPMFEYAVLARNYQLILLLTLIACAIWQHRRFSFVWYGVVIALLCFVHALGMIIAAALGFVLLLDAACTRAGWQAIRKHYVRFALFLAISAAGAWLSAKQTIPPPDSTYAVGTFPAWTQETGYFGQMPLRATTLARIWQTYVPIPPAHDISFWNHNFIDELSAAWPVPSFRTIDRTRWTGRPGLDFQMKWSIIFVVVATVFMFPSWRGPLFYLLATAGILIFFYMKLRGSTFMRHEGALFATLIGAFWIAWVSRSAPNPAAARWNRISRISWTVLTRSALMAFLLVQAWAGVITLYYLSQPTIDVHDRKGRSIGAVVRPIFVPSRRAAELIRKELRPGEILVSGNSSHASAVAAYLPGRQLYFPSENRWGSFTFWKQGHGNEATTEQILTFARSQKTSMIIIRCFDHQHIPGATVLAEFPAEIEPRESFSIQRLDPAHLVH